ncbi:MAG TPA: hypothetical protein VIL68_07515 [Propionibacteriaceae bacterium]
MLAPVDAVFPDGVTVVDGVEVVRDVVGAVARLPVAAGKVGCGPAVGDPPGSAVHAAGGEGVYGEGMFGPRTSGGANSGRSPFGPDCSLTSSSESPTPVGVGCPASGRPCQGSVCWGWPGVWMASSSSSLDLDAL